jgi:hypothetical protein
MGLIHLYQQPVVSRTASINELYGSINMISSYFDPLEYPLTDLSGAEQRVSRPNVLNAGQIVNAVMVLREKYLDVDCGMILMVDSPRTGLLHAAGHGFSREAKRSTREDIVCRADTTVWTETNACFIFDDRRTRSGMRGLCGISTNANMIARRVK